MKSSFWEDYGGIIIFGAVLAFIIVWVMASTPANTPEIMAPTYCDQHGC